ncbi:integrin alpha-4-like [Cloeon dipterum]|uniref:integrin alpha-4-like n=1 Tax=Cloeon dipterum TaxID=197152 RepID=UPI00322055E3
MKMIPRYCWVIFFVCWSIDQSIPVAARNVDDENPIVFHAPIDSEVEDYFGFSVALVAGDPKKPRKYPPWFLIGAPRAYHEGLTKGESYQCKLSPDAPDDILRLSCQHLPVSLTYPSLENSTTIHYNNSLYGSSQDAVGLKLYTTCSPHLQTLDTAKVSRMNGLCVVGSTTKVDSYSILEPLSNKDRAFEWSTRGAAMKNFVFGQSGFSARILSSSQAGLQLLIGAPNVHEGKGTVARYSLFKNVKTNQFEAGNLTVPGAGNISDYSKGQRLYLGYSISSGNLFSKNKTWYASGSPNHEVRGSVLIFDILPNNTMTRKQVLLGVQLGESFGYSLASGDISGDKLDELIVGAPFFTTNGGQNEGRVVIFSKNKANLLTQKYELKGTTAKGLFGTTVAFLGDLDKDRYGDFAVAAPFEGGGVIYLFFASAAGVSFGKKIVGTNYEPSISRFGFSISRGVDVDQNGFLDFAVGAYKSRHVVLFRTRPVVNLHHEFKLVEDFLTYNSTNFTLSSCVRYNGTRAPKSLDFGLKLELLGTSVRRIFYKTVESSVRLIENNITLERNNTSCTNFQFRFRENMTDYETPFKVTIQYLLPHNDAKSNVKDKVTTLSPVLAKPSLREVDVTFASMCSKDSCIADLRLDMRFYLANTGAEITRYVIGSDVSLLVRVTLTNLGMPALGSKLLLAYPRQLQPTIFGRCLDQEEDQATKSEIQCSVFTPLLAGKTETVELRFSGAELDAEKKLLVSASAISRSTLTNSSIVMQEKELKIESEAALSVSASPTEEPRRFDLYGNALQTLTYQFIIEKYGASPLHDAKIMITFPYAINNRKKSIFGFDWTVLSSSGECAPEEAESTEDEGDVLNLDQSAESDSSEEPNEGDHRRRKRDAQKLQKILPANRTLLLNCSSQLWECKSVTCKVGSFLTRAAYVTVNATMWIDFSALKKVLGSKDLVQIEAEAYVEVLKPVNVQKPKEQRPDQVTVTASFQRIMKNRDYFHDPFVLSLSTAVGLFLLLMLALGLSKAGFFKRNDIHVLQQRLRMQRPPIASLKDLQIMYDRCDTSDNE